MRAESSRCGHCVGVPTTSSQLTFIPCKRSTQQKTYIPRPALPSPCLAKSHTIANDDSMRDAPCYTPPNALFQEDVAVESREAGPHPPAESRVGAGSGFRLRSLMNTIDKTIHVIRASIYPRARFTTDDSTGRGTAMRVDRRNWRSEGRRWAGGRSARSKERQHSAGMGKSNVPVLRGPVVLTDEPEEGVARAVRYAVCWNHTLQNAHAA